MANELEKKWETAILYKAEVHRRYCGPGKRSRYSDSPTGWTVRGSNSVGGDTFRTRPDRPWGSPSLLYNGYQFFPGGKATETWRWPPTRYSAEVRERVKLYLFPLWTFLVCSRTSFSFTCYLSSQGIFLTTPKKITKISLKYSRYLGYVLKRNPPEYGIAMIHITLRCSVWCNYYRHPHRQGCTNPEGHVAVESEFCTLAPNLCAPSFWNSVHVAFPLPKNLRWSPGFWEICALIIIIIIFNTITIIIVVCKDINIFRKPITYLQEILL